MIALRRERDRLQARRAEAVDGRRRARDRDSRRASAICARDVPAGRAFGQRAAHEHVVDLAGSSFARAIACATAWPPIVAPCVMLNAPRQLLARPVRAVETMTASVMCAPSRIIR
jgi:hypothetical protein